MTTADWLSPFGRKFLPEDFNITDADSIEPWVNSLLEREVANGKELEGWLEDYSELMSIIGEDSSLRYVEMTCDTKSEEKKEAFLYFVREIQPRLTNWSFELDKKFYSSPFRLQLDEEQYAILDKKFSTSIELFDEKNIPLDVEIAEMAQNYQTITGAWLVEFEGKKLTMPQMGKLMLETDRSRREAAWRSMVGRRLEDAEKLESIFDAMLKTRHKYAANLGLADYREYCFKSKLRDYTPDDCHEFHDAIERCAVPLVKKFNAMRKKRMGLKTLRPWDMQVDPLGRNPLKPFDKVEELVSGVSEIFGKVDDRLGQRFDSITGSMDLDSRDGKAPGGYQTTMEEKRTPFIFTNAAGVHSDVITLLHEGGHAFHTLQCREQPLIWYRHTGMEMAEVASMTQELFANPYLDSFYHTKEDADRARLEQLERVVDIFPWVATIDAFQHWLYTNAGHSRKDRGEAWLSISSRFETDIDYSGLDDGVRLHSWHRQLHLFEVPFYYIEYAIAQLGALQLYRAYKENPKKTVDKYLHALTIGGSKGNAELFNAAGIKFDFSEAMLAPLMEMVEQEIEELEQGR